MPKVTPTVMPTRMSTVHRKPFLIAATAAAALLAGCGQMPSLPFGSGAGSSANPASGAPAASGTGAATTPTAAAAPDTSPALPTAVRIVTLSSDGLAGFFPFEGTTTISTRADRRREETSMKGTGTVSRFLLRDTGSATITRLDRKLVYGLDLPRAQYTECPLAGCPLPPAQEQPRQPQEPQSTREPGCTMRIAKNSFTVKPTSQRRAINGFDTEQYAVDWSVDFEDPTKRRSTLQLTVDVWTTAGSPAMREAMAVESAYNRAAAAAMQRALAERAAGLPPQLAETMTRYFGQSLTAADRTALLNAARQLERIRGEQILTQYKLFYRGDACGGAAADDGAGGGGRPGLAGALQGLLGGGGRSGGGGGDEAPLLSFTQEVKAWRMEPVRDSQFAPPPHFKRSNAP